MFGSFFLESLYKVKKDTNSCYDPWIQAVSIVDMDSLSLFIGIQLYSHGVDLLFILGRVNAHRSEHYLGPLG